MQRFTMTRVAVVLSAVIAFVATNDTATAFGGRGVVRDHRVGPLVRDHRSPTVVRDHRARPVVRDHRRRAAHRVTVSPSR